MNLNRRKSLRRFLLAKRRIDAAPVVITFF